MIAPELVALLRPQERFDVLSRRARRLGSRLLDLSYGNPAVVAPGVRDVLADALTRADDIELQYTPHGGTRVARRAAADALRATHDGGFDWPDVVLTTGAAAALLISVLSMRRPGGEVVIPVPCWLDHPVYVRAAGAKPVLARLSPDHALDPEVLGRALTPRTVAVLISDPGNPTGRTIGRTAWASLAKRLAAWDARHGTAITVIADETHRDFVWSDFASCVEAQPRSLVVYSLGKVHGVQGQRLGYVAVSPRHPERRAVSGELERWSRLAGMTTPDALMQAALPELIQLEHATSRIRRWQARFATGLRSAGYDVVDPDGTFFLYVRTPIGFTDVGWIEHMLAHERVLAMPAALFHHQGYFRLALTAEDGQLEEALGRLARLGERWSS